MFRLYSRGVETTRDRWLYNFSRAELSLNVEKLIETYNTEVQRWTQRKSKTNLDGFLSADEKRIKWSSRLKQQLEAGALAEFRPSQTRTASYRPFTRQFLYFDDVLIHRRGRLPEFFPTGKNRENTLLWLKVGSEWPTFALATSDIPDLLPAGGSQCFPFYTYAEDGTHRRENITDWALEQFRAHYHDPSITKWNIFHYIYAVLHHPEYRERYAANLRRELPRIPFAACTTGCHPEAAESSASPRTPHEGPMQLADSTVAASEYIGPSGRKERGPQDDIGVFKAFVKAGERLAEIHVHYEQQPEYKLAKVEKAGEKLDYAVTKMKLSKDKSTLIYNQFLTLSGIPNETHEYRLGNRSALEWVIDQYQVSTDKRSGITNDPNRADDPQYILRLIGQVITVSLETVNIVRSLPPLGLPE
ncbi:MAG: type ISP restriction/modification enzyme [Candidatus Sulfotelmatobacter sp.]